MLANTENIGISADNAAGEEQAFSLLMACLLAWIRGKLHYEHHNFLNTTFMNTWGSISKTQKGLTEARTSMRAWMPSDAAGQPLTERQQQGQCQRWGQRRQERVSDGSTRAANITDSSSSRSIDNSIGDDNSLVNATTTILLTTSAAATSTINTLQHAAVLSFIPGTHLKIFFLM